VSGFVIVIRSFLLHHLSSIIKASKAPTEPSSLIVPFLNLYELFPKEITRDMRDFQHFTQFLKTVTRLHYFQRPYMKMNNSKLFVATLADVAKALAIYEEARARKNWKDKRALENSTSSFSLLSSFSYPFKIAYFHLVLLVLKVYPKKGS
jgi:hypothetical protein